MRRKHNEPLPTPLIPLRPTSNFSPTPVHSGAVDDGEAEGNSGATSGSVELHTHDLEPQQVLQHRGEVDGAAQEDIKRGQRVVLLWLLLLLLLRCYC